MDRNEAIDIVRKNWPDGRYQLKEALETLIPELKENEDERIKNAIKEAVDHYWSDDTQARTNILSWLEKQGELLIQLKFYKDLNRIHKENYTKIVKELITEQQKKTTERANKEYWRGYREGKQEILDKYSELEKQGEHANFRNKIQIGDKVTRNKDGVLVNLSQLNRVAKKDEKQGEQKAIMNIPTREVILSIWDLGNEWKELTNGSISTKYGTQLDYIQKHWHESEYYLREKQGEPADKVEPKFKVGDTIYYNSFGKVKSMIVANVVIDSTDNPMYEDENGSAVFEKDIIEQKPADIQSIEKRAHEVFPDDDDENTPLYRQAFIDGAVDYIDCGCKNTAWNDEDEKMLSNIVDCIKNLPIFYESININGEDKTAKRFICDAINWLKSLKERMKGE